MIINKNQTPEAQYVGNIKANKVGIDTKNIDFVASLLTTNLYSNPIQSFIRETVSNGWDSHVEAGNKQPVIIDLSSSASAETFHSRTTYYYNSGTVDLTIKIRDFGVGLSPERFATIYTNIGSSTKRDSNDFIGAFGIGRFSCLSCSDSATLTSYYNGTKYSYLMYKDGAGINIDELGQWPTDEKNGLSVEVTLQMNREKREELIQAFNALVYFNCIYINDAQRLLGDFAYNFNKRSIKHYKTFSVWLSKDRNLTHNYSGETRINLLVGNCIYPFTKKQLANMVNFPLDWDIDIKFDIGEVDITPNREAILYNNKSDEIIKKRLEQALEEMRELFLTYTNNMSFVNIIEWYKFMSKSSYPILLPVDENKNISISIGKGTIYRWKISNKMTVNNETVPSNDTYDVLEYAMSSTFPRARVKFYYNRDSGKYYSNPPSSSYFTVDKLFTKHEVIITSENTWKAVLKDYVKDEIFCQKDWHSMSLVLYKPAMVKYLKQYILKNLIALDKSPKKANLRFILKHLNLDTWFKEINEKDIPLEYKTQWEKERNAAKNVSNTNTDKKEIRNCVITTLKDGSIYDYDLSGYKIVEDTTLYTLDALKAITSREIVYTTNSAEDKTELRALYYLYDRYFKVASRPIFIAVAPTNIPTIASLSNTKSLDEFIAEDRPEWRITNTISEEFRSVFKRNYHYFDSIRSIFPDLYQTISWYKTSIDSIARYSIPASVRPLFNSILKKYQDNNWKDEKLEIIQNNEKLLAFIRWVGYLSYGEHAEEHRLIIADYVHRIGLDTMSDEYYKTYTNSDFYKHIKTN